MTDVEALCKRWQRRRKTVQEAEPGETQHRFQQMRENVDGYTRRMMTLMSMEGIGVGKTLPPSNHYQEPKH